MGDAREDRLLDDSFRDYQERRARGETPAPQPYAKALDDSSPLFAKALEAQAALESLIEPIGLPAEPVAFGPYRLLRELGRGASGIVYEAIHENRPGRFAVKVLRAADHPSDVERERFRREALACARVRHGNIVEIHDAGEIGGRPYCAMSMVEGPTLKSVILSGRLPAPTEVCAGLAGVADALRALHDAGVVHRDVKPSNIVIAPDSRYVLTDFGLARDPALDSMTQTGEAVGTPLYMSPEQLTGRAGDVDHRSDIYGLGVTLYESLTGRAPFDCQSFAALARAVESQRPVPPGRFAPGLPPGCDRITMKALEKRREDRYQTAAAMRDDLQSAAARRGVRGRPVSGPRRVLRTVLARRGILVCAALLLSVVFVWLLRRPAFLEATSYPAADVLVNGTPAGRSPCRLTLRPGTQIVSFRRAGFRPLELTVTAAAGQALQSVVVLLPERQDDPAALRELAEALGVPFDTFRVPLERGAAPPAACAVHPRGRTRLVDLQGYRVEVLREMEVSAGCVLRFREGDDLLWEEPFPLKRVAEAPLPLGLRQKLKGGMVVRWGLWGPGGERFEATFEIVEEDKDLDVTLSRLAHLLRESPQGLALLQGHVLLERGYHVGALRVAGGTDCGALSLRLEALGRMGALESLVAAETRDALDAIPAQLRTDWFRD